MNLNKHSIIYIACPANCVTGGPETLHQLASKLKKKYNVFMYYYHHGKERNEIKIPEKFLKYTVSFTLEIEDCENNVLIVPEVKTSLLYDYTNIQKVIWWLSVDFYKLCFVPNMVKYKIGKYRLSKFNSIIVTPLLYLWYTINYYGEKHLDFKKDTNINNYFHLYNCQYCLDFLLNQGVLVENTEYLCGPISQEYFDFSNKEVYKQDIVVYNPKKGLEFSKKIISYIESLEDNTIKFIPIKNMTIIEIKALLQKSKVYMDFGFFPGPERIPREAALNYCNLITSNLGSAKNDVDILIPQDNKFELDNSNIEKISYKIINMIENYEQEVHYFDLYREKIINQVNLFDININKIFKIT